MATVVLTVSTVDTPLPDGVTSGNMRFTLTGSNGNVLQTQDVADVTATFLNVPGDTYTATAQRLASTGDNLGTSATTNVVVGSAPPVATFAAPNVLTATVTL